MVVVRQGRVAEKGRRWPIEAIRGWDTDGQPENENIFFHNFILPLPPLKPFEKYFFSHQYNKVR
jgi:hypothetical protein